MLLAHGIGGRTDLPVPTWLAAYGAGAAVAVSFAALLLLWPTPRLKGAAGGHALPAPIAAVLDAAAFRWLLRLVVLVVTGVVIAAALVGPDDGSSNLVVYALYITFWVGLVPASLLLGPIWRVVSPLRTLHGLIARLSGTAPETGLRPLPRGVGVWPAAGVLAAFTWLELVPANRTDPRLVGVLVVAYIAAMLVAASVYGDGWFAAADGFEVYSTTLGRLAPLGRRDDGRLAVRNPLDGLATTPAQPGIVALVSVLIGSTAFDGLTRTSWWNSLDPESVPLGTLGLAAMIGLVALTYTAATRWSGRIGGADSAAMPGRFAHSVVPIAIGYAVAHYFSLLLLDGQATWVLASDPFNTGADWFGTAGGSINYAALETSTIAWVQVGGIVAGHVVGVVAAHDRAVETFSRRDALRSQLPLLAVMVGYTMGGVALLLGG